MFMSITDDRNHIGNEWTCDKKLSEVNVRSNKWHETYQKRSFLVLSATRWTCSWSMIYFFCSQSRSRLAKKMFRSEAEKKTFSHRFWWVGRETGNKTFFFLPCCGYWLESHWRCVFNEYTQSVFWRNKQNYPLIITKDPAYLFHFLCAHRRLRSAWASAQSDQSRRCPLIEPLRSQGFFMRTAKTLIRIGGCPAWFESSLGS